MHKCEVCFEGRRDSMSQKKIFAYLDAQNEAKEDIFSMASFYDTNGVDGLFVYNYSADEKEREEFVLLLRELSDYMDIPFYAGCYVERLEDVKKIYYAGAKKVVLDPEYMSDTAVIRDAIIKFGAASVMVQLNCGIEETLVSSEVKQRNFDEIVELGVYGIMAKHVIPDEDFINTMQKLTCPVIVRDSLQRNTMTQLLTLPNLLGVATNQYADKDVYAIKKTLCEQGYEVSLPKSPILFSELKKLENGLVPVVVQDYKTNEVLMLAYMDEEAYNCTVSTGKMTYYSRSRKELWVKGLTSGHYQYVKALSIDCDNDTLLAKVKQVGAACHTGNHSCFYRDLVKAEWREEDTTNILEKIYATVMDRKQNPKEGSYTNYLFDKGIDKILKKCGEEATEIVIAAKNPDKTEIKYEIADFLYHVTVLMAECGINWNDVFDELANRD